MCQRLDVVANRQRVLRQMRELRASGNKIFYQDETRCNANHTREYVWQTDGDPDDLLRDTKWSGGFSVPCGSG